MEKLIKKILIEINESIKEYSGFDYFEDGLLDSLNFVDLVSELNDNFNIEIPTKYLKPEYFKNEKEILKLVKELSINK